MPFCWHCWFWEGLSLDFRGGRCASSRTLGPVWWQTWWRATFSPASCVCACVSDCVCACVCVRWEGERKRGRMWNRVGEHGGILTHYGYTAGWGWDGDEYIIACPLVSTHYKYNRWNRWTVSIQFGRFTSCSVQLSFIMCSPECIILLGPDYKIKLWPCRRI